MFVCVFGRGGEVINTKPKWKVYAHTKCWRCTPNGISIRIHWIRKTHSNGDNKCDMVSICRMVFVYVFQLESLLNVAIKFHYCVRSQCLRSFVCVSGDALFFLLLVVLGSQNSVRLSILLRRTMPFGQSFDTIFPYTHTHPHPLVSRFHYYHHLCVIVPSWLNSWQ